MALEQSASPGSQSRTLLISGSELSALLPSLYNLLPLPSACSVLEEVLSESVFRFGKGSKILTEPLIAWVIGPAGQSLIGSAEGGETVFCTCMIEAEPGRTARRGHCIRQTPLRVD